MAMLVHAGVRTPRLILIRIERLGRNAHGWLQPNKLQKLFLTAVSKIGRQAKSIVYSVLHDTKWHDADEFMFGRLMVRLAEAGLIWKAISTLLQFLREHWPAARRAIVDICKALALKAAVRIFWLVIAKLTGITETVWGKLKKLFEHLLDYLTAPVPIRV